jgi:hypothetical protein
VLPKLIRQTRSLLSAEQVQPLRTPVYEACF